MLIKIIDNKIYFSSEVIHYLELKKNDLIAILYLPKFKQSNSSKDLFIYKSSEGVRVKRMGEVLYIPIKAFKNSMTRYGTIKDCIIKTNFIKYRFKRGTKSDKIIRVKRIVNLK